VVQNSGSWARFGAFRLYQMQDGFVSQIEPIAGKGEGWTPACLHAKDIDVEVLDLVEQGLRRSKIEVVEAVHRHVGNERVWEQRMGCAMPNVRGEQTSPVRRLAREADDESQRLAGQVPYRWGSPRAKR
jgi:hypothetical protein